MYGFRYSATRSIKLIAMSPKFVDHGINLARGRQIELWPPRIEPLPNH